MYDRTHEDRISRRISRLIAQAEEDGTDSDPEFLDLLDKLYSERERILGRESFRTFTHATQPGPNDFGD